MWAAPGSPASYDSPDGVWANLRPAASPAVPDVALPEGAPLCVAVQGGRFAWVGPQSQLPADYRALRRTDAQDALATPGGCTGGRGPADPGHAHAFQRAFAGLTEYRGKSQDSFWSWRDLMYRFAARITPESLEAIAEAGYTSVCEFHFVLHAQGGMPYADEPRCRWRCPCQRPVQWLLAHAPVDERWCLVHATHMTPAEYAAAAATCAVAGICPTTEANLGDGIFDMPLWQRYGGRWGVGSDSHACVNAAEELLVLEYGQRLSRRQRNVLATAGQPEVGTAMTLQAVAGGAQASGRAVGGAVAGLAVGQRAYMVALDAQHVALRDLPAHSMLSAHVFGSHRTSTIDSVWTAGVRRIAQGRHALHDSAAQAFVAARSATIALGA